MSAVQYQLVEPPEDGISSLRFGHISNNLLVSSWDKSLYLYSASDNKLLSSFEGPHSLLCCDFDQDDTHAYSGALDGQVTYIDLSTGRATALGTHDKAVKCIGYNSNTRLAVSGSWDENIKLWDSNSSSRNAVSSHKVEGKVYAMDQVDNFVIVGLNNRKVVIFDIRRMGTPLQVREPCLKHQTRCIRAFTDGSGYIVSSIEGRIAVEYMDPSPETQQQKYAFKCHRAKINGTAVIYPINAVAFHPVYGTFTTGGCDGMVHMWDGGSRKRVATLPKYPISISSLDFNKDGTLLAIASSYTFEHGEQEHPDDQVYIRVVSPGEVMPKRRK